mgnify:FL=1
MSSHNQYFSVRLAMSGLSKNLHAINLRHAEVGEHHIELVLIKEAGARNSAGGYGAFVALALKGFSPHLGMGLLIIDDEYAYALSGPWVAHGKAGSSVI